MLLEHGASPMTRAWREWDPQDARGTGWGDRDAVLAAVEAGDKPAVDLFLQRICREPVQSPEQVEAIDR